MVEKMKVWIVFDSVCNAMDDVFVDVFSSYESAKKFIDSSNMPSNLFIEEWDVTE